MEKLHYFLYGKELTLETDQKPLVSIYKKHMVDISPRVQRLIVSSFPYLPFKVVYKKGKDIPVADALSHVTPMDPDDNIQLPIIAVNMITTCILMSVQPQDSFSNKLDQLRKSTAQDNQLTRLSHYINRGFPCDKKNLLTELHEFWNHREALSIESGLITCGNRVVVPRKMRPEMLQYIHEGHQGKERCLLQERNTVFWPKICMMYRNSLKDVSYAKNMGNHNQSLVLLKNFHLSHGTHWQQISFTGREWTFS